MTWDPVSGKWYGPPELSYPHAPFILGVVFTAVVVPAVGVAVLVGMQLFVRSFWDLNAGLFGLFKGLVMMWVFSLLIMVLCRFRRAAIAWLEGRVLSIDMIFRTFIQIFLKQWIGKGDCCVMFCHGMQTDPM